MQEIRAVVMKVEPHNVIQLVTDNGSNYKKACKIICHEFPTIAWQPCLAHTINLMLKDIGSGRSMMLVFEARNEFAAGSTTPIVYIA